jgi:hypothetical protein
MSAQWPLFFPAVLVPCAVGCLVLTAGGLARSNATAAVAVRQRLRGAALPLLLAVALVAICLVFVLLTDNLKANGVPLLFASRLVNVAILRSSRGSRVPRKVSPGFCVIRVSGTIADRQLALVRLEFRSPGEQHELVRHALHGNNDASRADAQASRIPCLDPASYPGTIGDFAQVVRFFRSRSGNFLLVGDSSILYALTGRPSASPVLWFDPGQTLPNEESPLFPSFQQRLLNALSTYRVRYVVVEATKLRKGRAGTWSGVNLATFPALQRLVAVAGSVREVIGPFTIYEIRGFDGARDPE